MIRHDHPVSPEHLASLEAAVNKLHANAAQTVSFDYLGGLMSEHSMEWTLNIRMIGRGVEKATAIRRQEVGQSVVNAFDLSLYRTKEQVAGFQAARAVLFTPYPMRGRHAASLFELERDLIVLENPLKQSGFEENEVLKLTDTQKDVVERLLLPWPDISQELGLSRTTINNRQSAVLSKNKLTRRQLMTQAWNQGLFKEHTLPEVVAREVLSDEQLKYVVKNAFAPSTNNATWKEIHGLLGTKTANEAFIVVVKDDSVDK